MKKRIGLNIAWIDSVEQSFEKWMALGCKNVKLILKVITFSKDVREKLKSFNFSGKR